MDNATDNATDKDTDREVNGGPSETSQPGWVKLALPVLVVLAVLAGLAAYGAWRLSNQGTALAPSNMIRLSVPDETPSPLKGFAIRPERPAPDFTLTDSTGKPWRLADHKGQAVALFFGYTHCPDVCPQTMALLSQATGQMGVDADKLAVAFITVDPDRDTPEVLARYAQAFDPSFVGLTGKPEEIQRIAAAYGVEFLKELSPAQATQAAAIAGHDEAAGAGHDDGHEHADATGMAPMTTGTESASGTEAGGEPNATGGAEANLFTPGTGAYTVAHSGVVFLIDGQGQLRSSFLLPFDPADVVHDVRFVLGGSQG